MNKFLIPFLICIYSLNAFGITPFPANSDGTGTSALGIDPSSSAIASADGKFILFTSESNDIIADLVDDNGAQDVFLLNVESGELKLVSHKVGDSNAVVNAESSGLDLSGDGRYVLFNSYATDLVTGFVDNNGAIGKDLYVWDRETGNTKLVSAAFGSSTQGANNGLSFATISGDGSAVVFAGNTSNLVSGLVDTNGSNTEVFYRSLITDTTKLVSHRHDSQTVTSNFVSFINTQASLSEDGKKVAYISTSDDILAGLVAIYNIYIYDADSGSNSLVSHAANSLTTAGDSYANRYMLTRDGSKVIFSGTASNHINGFINNNSSDEEVYSYRVSDGALNLVSHDVSSGISGPNGDTEIGAVNFDGSVIALISKATNLVSGLTDTNTENDIFVIEDGVVSLISKNLLGNAGNGESATPVLSSSGRYLSFSSLSSDLVTNDLGGYADVFFIDLKTNTLECISKANNSVQTGNFHSYAPFIGRQSYGFLTQATDIVTNDLNGNLIDGLYQTFNHLTITAPQTPEIVDSLTTTVSGLAESGSLIRIYKDIDNNNKIDSVDLAIFESQLPDGLTNFTFTNVPLTQSSINNFLVVSVDNAGLESFVQDIPTIQDVPTYSAKIRKNKAGVKILVIKNENNQVVYRKAAFGKYSGKVRVRKVDVNMDGILDIRVRAKINGKKKTKLFNGVDLTKI